MLKEELSKLDKSDLLNIINTWGMPCKSSNKRILITNIIDKYTDEFYIKNALEHLTPLQVDILCLILKNKEVLTLGEISRKMKLQPLNIEQELAVLKHLMFIYQRKNRERITNNLDKYHIYDELKSRILIKTNVNAIQLNISIGASLRLFDISNLNKKYVSIVGKKLSKEEFIKQAVEVKTTKKILKTLTTEEASLVDEIFQSGGMLEIDVVRTSLQEKKLPFEKTLRKLDEFNLAKDIYFVDSRFMRILVIPNEVFDYLKQEPIFIQETGIKEMGEKMICNELDAILNMKKLILFISNKGITLTQSEKIKQVDLKRTEENFLDIDLSLFREKSQTYQIEVILPLLKLFSIVDVKSDNITLEPAADTFLKVEPLNLMKSLLNKINEAEG